MESILNREQLKELIQVIYDDNDFANFNLHFVDEVEPHKVYVIKNNRIFNELTRTTLIMVDSIVTDYQIHEMSLYGIDVKEHLFREMVAESANKILTDIYKVNNKDWFYDRINPVNIELTITNWYLHSELIENGIRFILRFEIGEIV
jgi:hypothetical protein